MRAVAQRAPGNTAHHPDQVIWHVPVGRVVEEFQAIACDPAEGIVMPPPKQDVPLTLTAAGEAWCGGCVAAVRAARRRTRQARSTAA